MLNFMNEKLTYTNEQGFMVFTSEHLRKRGHCCKSACLHCPYGFTLKKHGLEFFEFDGDPSYLSELGIDADALGGYLPQNILVISLKGVKCGLLLKTHIQVKKVFLKEHFRHQGLSLEMVESYLFI